MDNKEQKSLSQIIEYRIKKIDELKNNNINPYPYKFNKEFDISYILNHEKELEKQKIATAGRLVSLRNMGKACFMNIKDEFD